VALEVAASAGLVRFPAIPQCGLIGDERAVAVGKAIAPLAMSGLKKPNDQLYQSGWNGTPSKIAKGCVSEAARARA